MHLKVVILIVVSLLLDVLNCLAESDSDKHTVNVQISELALLGLVPEGNAAINVQSLAPNEVGEAVLLNEATSAAHVWINYSSIISSSTPARKVVAFVQGDIPEGITLKVEVSEVSGSGKGNLGKSSGLVTLSNQPSDVIVDIGSCYTGKGTNNGHFLSYTIEQDEDAEVKLSEQDLSLNVIYKLTDSE